MNFKKLERYLRVNFLRPGPRLIKKELSGPRSHRGSETLFYGELYSTFTVMLSTLNLSVIHNLRASLRPSKCFVIPRLTNNISCRYRIFVTYPPTNRHIPAQSVSSKYYDCM